MPIAPAFGVQLLPRVAESARSNESELTIAGLYWKAPRSGFAVRSVPRWSVVTPVPLAPVCRAAVLPAVRAIVRVGPPLSASPAAVKFGLVPATSALRAGRWPRCR